MSEATIDATDREVEQQSEFLPLGSLERAAAKERIKLAYLSGSQTLLAGAVKEGISYHTVMRWSKEECWHGTKEVVAKTADLKTAENITDLIAEERTKQIKRALARAQKIQERIDKAAENEESAPEGLLASAVQALASAEERADNIVRRNLGMDQQSGGNSSVSINILAGGISLS
jgi:hypothetical protein